MTLLITTVAGDGIVMGADSALTLPKNQENDEIICLDNFPKIIFAPKQYIGISIGGSIRQPSQKGVGPLYKWLREFALSSEATTFIEFIDTLVIGLNTHFKCSSLVALIVATWVKADEGTFPVVYEISNGTGNYESKGQLISPQTISRIMKWKEGDRSSYPIEFVTAGLPHNYSKWIGEVGLKQHSELIGRQILCSDITSVAEYVRFLIKSIGDLYRISGQPGFVGGPVEIAIIPPETLKYISIKY